MSREPCYDTQSRLGWRRAELGRLARNQERRHRAGGLHLASVADEEVAEGHGQWRNSELEARRDAARVSAVEGGGAAISALTADYCSRVFGRELAETGKVGWGGW